MLEFRKAGWDGNGYFYSRDMLIDKKEIIALEPDFKRDVINIYLKGGRMICANNSYKDAMEIYKDDNQKYYMYGEEVSEEVYKKEKLKLLKEEQKYQEQRYITYKEKHHIDVK